ncbi:solute carrier family 23 protein [Massilia phosphatilytica]
MIVLGMLPKMAALVEAIPQFVLGGAGLVMFGMVAAAGIRILTRASGTTARDLYIVALSIGFGLIPLVAPRWAQQMAHSLHPLLESGILLTAVAAVALNLFLTEPATSLPRATGTRAPPITTNRSSKGAKHEKKTVLTMALCACAATSVQAAEWSGTSIGYRTGSRFREPYARRRPPQGHPRHRPCERL